MQGPADHGIPQPPAEPAVEAGPAPERITLQQALDDVDQFFATLERVHPNLLAKVDPQDYPKLKKRTTDEVTAKAGPNGEVSVTDLTSALASAGAFFKDGHTHVGGIGTASIASGSQRQLLQERRFPPFWLTPDNGRLRIGASKDPSLRGLEITAVDGVPLLELLRPVIDRLSAETFTFKIALVAYAQPLLFAEATQTPYKLKLRDAHGTDRDYEAVPVGVAEYSGLMPADMRKPYGMDGKYPSGTRVAFLDSGKVAHFVYPAFTNNAAERGKIDAVFRQIKDSGAQELILDLRGNGGGSSDPGDYIFSYLYSGAFRQFSEVRVKVSRDVFKGTLPAPEGTVTANPFPEKSFPKPQAFFSGKIYLLTSNFTFSSAQVSQPCFAIIGPA